MNNIELVRNVPTWQKHGRGSEIETRIYFRVKGSSRDPLLAKITDDNYGWLERFAQACYDRGRFDEKGSPQ